MNPIEYARSKKWETVRYTLIYEKGEKETKPTERMKPEEISTLPVASQSAYLTKEEEGRAYFMSYSEKENVFIDLRDTNVVNEPPERVIIVMEHVKE
ncbi:hypothetical protein H839_08274 [Parageobacillus genomosp. 1]|uniref:Lipoprotein n=1 Tax=Parageobacillus genomosp. 1 TaxID=1295642 RepID=A0ABC9VGH3_9BACL|nr:hypothetical protein [Parageobacillus genomosp. 1]EZP77614.1 hypothetical protein H839_08274 [Parageobacillus genomosp. 1]